MVKNFLDYYQAVNKRKRKTNEEKEYTKHLQYARNKNYGEKRDEYNQARESLGYQPDDRVTKRKYDSYVGNEKTGDKGIAGRMQEYYAQHPDRKPVQQELNKPFKKSADLKVNNNQEKANKPSFDEKVDKGVKGLASFIDKVKNSKVVQGAEDLAKKIDDNKVGHAYEKVAKTLINHTPAGQQVENMKTMNKAMPYVDQYGGANSTRNVLADLTDKKDQTSKQYIDDIKGGFSGKKNTKGEEIAKNLGVKSKYGGKAAGLGIELVADPTNFIPSGIAGKVLKSASKISELSKVGKVTGEAIKAADFEKTVAEVAKTQKVSKTQAKQIIKNLNNLKKPEETKTISKLVDQLTPKEKNLQNISLPKGKIDVQPTIKKSLNDLMGKNKQITEVEKPIEQMQKIEPTKEAAPLRDVSLEQIVKEHGFNEVTPETIAKSFNNKDWYHGTGTANLTPEDVDPFYGNHEGLFGNGVYLTDEPKIAEGYANARSKSSKTPTIYNAKMNVNRVLDLEKPASNESKQAIYKTIENLDHAYESDFGESKHFTNAMDELFKNPNATPEEAVQLLREKIKEYSHDAEIPTSEFANDFQDLVVHLKESGYDAVTHTGGHRTGHDPHRVSILLDPHDNYSNTGRNGQLTKFEKFDNTPKEIETPINTSNEPVSITDSFQNAINKAKETNNPQDIESIKQHTQKLIDDLDTNYKDPDTEEVKDALAKLNLQLFAGKEPVQETLNKISGVVERAKTLKKDIKETNPQLAKEIQGIKDINSVGKASRNLYEIVDKLPKQLQNQILPVLNKAKPDNVNYQKMYVEDLDRNIVNPKTGLGIKKGSKDSALIQDYGEKTLAKKELEKQGYDQEQINKMNPEELSALNDKILKEQYPDKYDGIKKADNFFKERYKELIDAANGTIAKIYPGQPDKLIPERTDYYHHFNEMEGLEGVINQFRTPENINPDLVTVSHGTKPKTKWQAFKQKRGLGEYKSDAVGGFLKYIQGVSHTTHVDPVIPAIRNVVKDLQNATEESKNINNIIEALNDHADDIAGKTNPYDRTIQKVLGRANLRRLNALNGRVKSNMILGNVGSTVAQVGNLPLITAEAKHHLAPGLYDTLEQFSRYAVKNKKELPINKSKFLRERFIDEDFNKFDTKILDQPKKLAVKMMTMVDKATASLAWNSFYRKGLSKKVADPIKYADELTRNTIAGRGIGEMGMGQKSKTAQIFMPFTYEVGHQWKVLNKMVGNKDAAGIMTFLITSYALNKVIEEVRGSGVTFDPIDALIDGYQNGEGDKKHKVLAALGSLSGEVVGNIPGGSSLTGAIGDKKLFGSDVSLKDIFQDRDPNRFGSGITAAKAIESPSFALLPFGANQIKKGWESHKAIKEGGVFTKNGQMMYPVDTSSNLKKAQMFTFGKYSPSEARDYFNEKRLPLSPKRTEKVQKADDKFKEYNNQLIQLLENKKKRNKGDLNKLKKIDQQIAELKEKNK